MNAECIGYTLSRIQWEGLRLTLELPDPLHVLETPVTAEAWRPEREALCDLGLLIPSGDRVIVDALFGYLLTELSGATAALELDLGDRRATLARAPHMLLLAEALPERLTLTPLQNAASARPMLDAALARCPVPGRMALRGRDAVRFSEVPESPEAARARLDQLFEALVGDTAPEFDLS